MTMPPLTVTIAREGRVCVLSVSGELDIATTPTLTRQAAAVLQDPAERLIIDLSGLEFLDCCGVRALAAVAPPLPRLPGPGPRGRHRPAGSWTCWPCRWNGPAP